MIASLHNGITALKSLTQGLQVLGNNISNVNSLGYKSTRANYSDNFYLHLNDAESGADGIPSNNLQHKELELMLVLFPLIFLQMTIGNNWIRLRFSDSRRSTP